MKFLLGIIIVLVFLTGCVQLADQNSETSIPEGAVLTGQQETIEFALEISTDKAEYGSHEEVYINLIISSPENIENALVKVWGIAPRSTNYIEDEQTVSLQRGENTIQFVEETPNCTSGCGGVTPGEYVLYASVDVNSETVAEAETKITLISN